MTGSIHIVRRTADLLQSITPRSHSDEALSPELAGHVTPDTIADPSGMMDASAALFRPRLTWAAEVD
jgi:hypothetical protein